MDIIDNLPKKFMREFAESGGQLTLCLDENKVPYLNLNTGMKSHLHLYCDEDGYFVKGRYGYLGKITYFADLSGAIIDCEHGKGFMASSITNVYENGFKDQWEKFE